VRRNFADDIKGVLSGFNSSSLNGDGGKAAQAPLVAPAAVGTVWRDEKVRVTLEGVYAHKTLDHYRLYSKK